MEERTSQYVEKQTGHMGGRQSMEAYNKETQGSLSIKSGEGSKKTTKRNHSNTLLAKGVTGKM